MQMSRERVLDGVIYEKKHVLRFFFCPFYQKNPPPPKKNSNNNNNKNKTKSPKSTVVAVQKKNIPQYTHTTVELAASFFF